MDTACYQYSLGMEVDSQKLSKISSLTQIGKLEVMEAKFGELKIHVFKTGEIRAFVPGEKIENLQQTLLASGIKITELLAEIKKAGYAIDEQKVLSDGHPMLFEYLAPGGVRPNFKGISVNILRELAYAPYEIAQTFQLERNAVQAGENAGRRIIGKNSPKDMKAVNKFLSDFIKDEGVGTPSFSEEKDERSTYPAIILKLEESAFAAGMPSINKPYCHFVRGLLRGAYVSFYEMENIDVKEENCWGLGDNFCQFKATVHPK